MQCKVSTPSKTHDSCVRKGRESGKKTPHSGPSETRDVPPNPHVIGEKARQEQKLVRTFSRPFSSAGINRYGTRTFFGILLQAKMSMWFGSECLQNSPQNDRQLGHVLRARAGQNSMASGHCVAAEFGPSHANSSEQTAAEDF